MTMRWLGGVTGNGSSITRFDNIPQTFSHLQIRFTSRGLVNASTDFTYMRLNDDAGFGNYASHWVAGEGTTAFSSNLTGSGHNYLYGTIFPGNTAPANVFGSLIVDILDYSSTTKNKTIRMLGGYDANGAGAIRLVSGLWLNTSAVTSLVCSVASSYDVSGSRADLYGITNNPIATGA